LPTGSVSKSAAGIPLKSFILKLTFFPNDNNRVVKYQSSALNGDIFDTISWQLNLQTGEIIFKFVTPGGKISPIRASYDFQLAILFFKIESDSRLSNESLGKLQQVTDKVYSINEYGAIEKMSFLENQTISIKNVIGDYDEVIDDDGETDNRLSNSVGDDRLISFQFEPKFSGKLQGFRIPIKIKDQSGPPLGSNVAINFDIYLSNGGIDYSTTDGINPATPPTSASILTLLNTTLFIDFDLLDPLTDETEYRWFYFDVSAASVSVTKDTKYGIILRCDNTVELFNFFVLSKKVTNPDNRTINDTIGDGVDITTYTASWTVSNSPPSVMLSQVEIKKDSHELKSIHILDTLNPNITSNFNSLLGGAANTTIAVYSSDFTIKYINATDYTITYSGAKFTINFLTLGIDDVIIVQWFESLSDTLLITDIAEKAIKHISESSFHGDDNTFRRVIIKGQKLRPSNSSVSVSKTFDMFPGLDKLIEDDIRQVKRIESVGTEQWKDANNDFGSELEISAASKKFVFDFNDPVVTGTTAYRVKQGLGKTTDKIANGTLTIATTEDVPLFYEIDVSSALFTGEGYNVIIETKFYKEWRLATVEDFDDMLVEFVVGTIPTSVDDVITNNHFYFKHMNGFFGHDSIQWVAYESRQSLFYIDADGAVLQDDEFSNESTKNPFKTAHTDKRISVEVAAVDIKGNPLFPIHSESGKDGFDSAADSAIKIWASARVSRVNIQTFGINATYDNYGLEKKLLDIDVVGFPINKITELKIDIKSPGFNHADAKVLSIDNELIQHQAILDRRGRSLHNFWNQDRLVFDKLASYFPQLKPGTIVRVKSEVEGFTDDVFVIMNSNHQFSLADGMTSRLGELLQI